MPTKALVKDKVTSDKYKDLQVQGVSEDYPIGNRKLNLHNKIIVTYKSLPRVAELLDINNYHLLIDEAHMLISMTGYARLELEWLMANFSKFRSYCFMSATVPRKENLLPELRDLPLVQMVWDEVVRIDFNCLVSDSITESLLAIILSHHKGESEGTPYFFYNAVSGICKVIEKWRANPKVDGTFNVVCANTHENREKLKKCKLHVGSPNKKADFHFITATAFEGVDFFDPEGRTYIISDKSYLSTKYSIETTIPQIVGRLRDSRFNSQITVVFNQHDKFVDMTPREFSAYLDQREAEAAKSVELYNKALEDYQKTSIGSEALQDMLAGLIKRPYVLVEGSIKSLEDAVADVKLNGKTFPKVSAYPYARVLAQQTYDILQEQMYVRGAEEPADIRPLSSEANPAPILSEDEALDFKIKKTGLAAICRLYEENPVACQINHPDWFHTIDTLGVDLCRSLSYNKSRVRKYQRSLEKLDSEELETKVYRVFKVGRSYPVNYIKETLKNLGVEKAKGTSLIRWFDVTRTTVNGATAYRIIRKLTGEF